MYAKLAVALGLAGFGAAHAAEAEPPTNEELDAERAGYVHQVERRKEAEFDPSIFTGLSPVTVDETPVRLPDDQSLE